MSQTREIKHRGCTAVIYGESSIIVYDENGEQIAHSGSRDKNMTDEQARNFIDLVLDMPLDKIICSKFDDDNGED